MPHHAAIQNRRSYRLSCYASVLVVRRGCGELEGLMANVSMEGASVVVPRAIPKGTRVDLLLVASGRLGADPARPVKKRAEVVWVRETPETSVAARLGLRFIEPDIDLLLRAWPGERLPG